jgi:hypothetical protein
MDRNTIFGGNPVAVIVRLIVLSIVVGIVLSAMGITPQNLLWRLDELIRHLYHLGFGAIEWILGYLVLGAIVVVPIWIIARVLGLMGTRSSDDRNQ